MFRELEDELPTEVYSELFLDLKYENMQRGETVFNFGELVSSASCVLTSCELLLGDNARKFYIIMKGTVFILLPKNKKPGEERESMSPGLERGYKEETLEDAVHRKNPGFSIAHTMTAGSSFGEIALRMKTTRSLYLYAPFKYRAL